MAKSVKQFKLGEWCLGGIIQVFINNDIITIKALDWDSKKEVSSQTFMKGEDTRSHIEIYLNDLTSFYYTEKIIEWIGGKINLR